MMSLYTFLLYLYRALLKGATLFVPKAQLLWEGQKRSQKDLDQWLSTLPSKRNLIWMHCASLGEFEQGRPVLERIQQEYPSVFILLSFYSPSGFEVRKSTPLAHQVVYLTPDFPANVNAWVSKIAPDFFITVKYEVWPNLFYALNRAGVPIFMLSAIFRKDHRYFGWMSFFWRPVLRNVSHFFVQNTISGEMLDRMGITSHTLIGDTRYDRVFALSKNTVLPEVYEHWIGDTPVIILGSSYSTEESIVKFIWNDWKGRFKLIIAPHHIDDENISRIMMEWEGDIFLATDLKGNKSIDMRKGVMLLNTMGELGGLYSKGILAVVGGGWEGGIHNTLEPAAHGLAVVWGPKDHGFEEAKRLSDEGGGNRFGAPQQLKDWLSVHLGDHAVLRKMGQSAQRHVQSNTGATEQFMKFFRPLLDEKKN